MMGMLHALKSPKMIVFFILLLLAGIFISFQGDEPTKEEAANASELLDLVVDIDEDIPEDQKDQDSQEAEPRVGEEAGILYADLLCTVADPAFWDYFFSGESQTAEEFATEEARTLAFYQAHGYASEEQGNLDIINSWGTEGFIDNVNAQVANNGDCIVKVTDQGIILEDLLGGPAPELDG